MKSEQAEVGNMKLTVELLSEEGFSRYKDSWNRLLEVSTSESFFLKWEWLFTFWETIDTNNTVLMVWLCHDGAELVGIAPFYMYSAMFMGIPVRKVAFLGDRVASDYMDIFAKPGYEEICCRQVLQQMRDQSPVPYDLIDLNGVCADSNLYNFLSEAVDQTEDVIILPSYECPRTMLDTSFDGYIAGLSASTRYMLRRKQRRIERDFGAITTQHLDLAQYPQLLDVLFSLHKDRWDTLQGKSSTFCTTFRKTFNERLLQRLDDGDGIFSCVTIGAKPASILYILNYKHNAFFYQNGWDPAFENYSIGIYNIYQAIRHAIDMGCKSFDFLRGEEGYKYKFCEDVRQAYIVLLFGKGIPGNLIKGLFLLKLLVKKLRGRYLRFGQSGIKVRNIYSSLFQGQSS